MGIFTAPLSDGTSVIIGAIGFLMMIAGIILGLMGWITYSTAKREYNLYFDMRDQIDNPDVMQRMSNMKRGKIMLIVGVVFIVVSLFLN